MRFVKHIRNLLVACSVLAALIIVPAVSAVVEHLCCAEAAARLEVGGQLAQSGAQTPTHLKHQQAIKTAVQAQAQSAASHGAHHLDMIGDDCNTASCGGCVAQAQIATGDLATTIYYGPNHIKLGGTSFASAAAGHNPPPPRLS